MIYNKNVTTTIRRTTKYTNEIAEILHNLRHATNAEIARELRRKYSKVSDTTVHRVTKRLQQDGAIGLAPSNCQGCARYDAKFEPHDHFCCSQCGALRDITIATHIRDEIQCSLGDCRFDGPLVVSGICQTCQAK